MNIGKDKTKLAKLIILITGVPFFIIGIVFGIYYMNVLGDSIELTGTIVSCDDDYTVISFELDGQYYEQSVLEHNDLDYVGKEIKIYYSYKTNHIYTKSFVWLFPSVFGGIGLISIISYIIFCYIIGSRKKFLLEKDKYIKKIAKIVNIKKNRLYSLNGFHPNQLICEVYYEGEKLTIKSHLIWKDIMFEENNIVNVYFKNKQKYVIDVESYRKNEFELIEEVIDENKY